MFHESIKSSQGDPKFFGPENSKFPHVPEERTNSEKSQEKPTSHQNRSPQVPEDSSLGLFDQFGLFLPVQTDLTETDPDQLIKSSLG
ncbi:Oidioi.mRNA.OKI2018_I69.chr2.g7204.t3.cds [Oikopleura dioica]|nr:Oidioi.mRNA.OKI2018_I69.chr2.g7204.t3.cds [Oikopleura dioica]